MWWLESADRWMLWVPSLKIRSSTNITAYDRIFAPPVLQFATIDFSKDNLASMLLF